MPPIERVVRWLRGAGHCGPDRRGTLTGRFGGAAESRAGALRVGEPGIPATNSGFQPEADTDQDQEPRQHERPVGDSSHAEQGDEQADHDGGCPDVAQGEGGQHAAESGRSGVRWLSRDLGTRTPPGHCSRLTRAACAEVVEPLAYLFVAVRVRTIPAVT